MQTLRFPIFYVDASILRRFWKNRATSAVRSPTFHEEVFCWRRFLAHAVTYLPWSDFVMTRCPQCDYSLTGVKITSLMGNCAKTTLYFLARRFNSNFLEFWDEPEIFDHVSGWIRTRPEPCILHILHEYFGMAPTFIFLSFGMDPKKFPSGFF